MESLANSSPATEPTQSQQRGDKVRSQTCLSKQLRVVSYRIPLFLLMKLFKCMPTIKLNLTPYFANTENKQILSRFRLIFKVLDSLKSSSTSLGLDFGRCGNFPIISAKELSQCFQRFRSLNNLSLNFSYSSSLSPKYIDALFLGFKRLNHLQKLHFNWTQCSSLNEKSLRSLLWRLRRSKSLSNLHLDFTECSHFNDKSFQLLAKGIKSHKNLQILIVKFHMNAHLAPRGFQDLVANLKNLSRMTRLNLKFSKTYKIFNQDFYEALFDSLIAMKNLEDFSFDSTGSKTSLREGLNIFERFQECPMLRNLRLVFDHFFGSLELLINGISSSLPKLEKLEYLELHFSQAKDFSDVAVNSLCTGLNQMKNLKELNLDFSQCIELTDSSLEGLLNSLKESKSLQKLVLDIQWCKKISKNAEKKLKNNLKGIEVRIRSS